MSPSTAHAMCSNRHLQAVLYREVVIRGDDGWLLYNFEPRLGLFFVESLIWPGRPLPGLFSWASVLALTLMAALLLMDVAGLPRLSHLRDRLALPTVFLFGMILVSNAPLGPGSPRWTLRRRPSRS